MQETRRRDHNTAEGGERRTPPPIDGVELPLLEGALAREVSGTADQCRRHGLRAEAAHAATVQQPHKMDAHERGWSAACLGHQRPLVQRPLVRVEEPSSHSGRHAERESSASAAGARESVVAGAAAADAVAIDKDAAQGGIGPHKRAIDGPLQRALVAVFIVVFKAPLAEKRVPCIGRVRGDADV